MSNWTILLLVVSFFFNLVALHGVVVLTGKVEKIKNVLHKINDLMKVQEELCHHWHGVENVMKEIREGVKG